ncbi:hypothetical protein SAMN06265338_1351, partial [Rhodoblastus acidophilus]
DLPDLEALEDAGLLDKAALRDGPLPSPLLDDESDDAPGEDDDPD